MRKMIIALLILFINNAQSQTNAQIVTTELNKLVTNATLLPNDVLNWIQTDNTTSQQNQISHVYFRQAKYGLEINGTESAIHILPDKSILTSNFNFINNLDSKITSQIQPTITPIQAVQFASTNLNYTITNPLTVINSSLTGQNQTISKGGISKIDIPVKLSYQRLTNNQVVLVWDLYIQSSQKEEAYIVKVNAVSGVIEDKVDTVLTCNFSNDKHQHEKIIQSESISETWDFKSMFKKENFTSNSIIPPFGTYNVFAVPIESPYYGARSLVTNVENLNASPYGWHDTNATIGAEFTVTRGNNVNAYRNVGATVVQPDGGAGLVFDYPLNITFSTTNPSESASITNLFYYNNIIHDIMYNYGFDEVSGNFQTSNYNSGLGLGNDQVNARALIGQNANATFGTPLDGTAPSMSMYYNLTQDGDLENLVIAHEYGHGISKRLTGGPATNCLNNGEQMGEGWSDWYGLMLSMEASDTDTTSRTVGNYLFNQGVIGNGIRPYPYNTLMSVNPHTYNSIKTSGAPHGLGSVWCAMLWEMTWNLIDVYGFDSNFYNGTGGNNKAMKLVTLALKLQPCSLGFVDGRNALLAADQAIYGGANQCLIWDAFAKRGLGFSAQQGLSTNNQDGIEAYDLPAGICSCPVNLNVETIVLSPNIFTRQASSNITAINRINTGAKAIYHAGNSVVLKNGFYSQNGSTFRGYIEGCTNVFVGRSSSQVETIRASKNINQNSLNSISIKTKIYPNPANNKFFIENLNNVRSVEISDINGKQLIQTTFTDELQIQEIDITLLDKGFYIIKTLDYLGNLNIDKLIKK